MCAQSISNEVSSARQSAAAGVPSPVVENRPVAIPERGLQGQRDELVGDEGGLDKHDRLAWSMDFDLQLGSVD